MLEDDTLNLSDTIDKGKNGEFMSENELKYM